MSVDHGRALPVQKRSGMAIIIVVGAILLVLPYVTNNYTQYILNLIIVYAALGTGFNIVLGFLGQLAFANAALFGIGAYTTVIMSSSYGAPFEVAMVASGAFGATVAALIAVPALRGLRSFYLAIVTLAFGELMRFSYIHGGAITGGSTGLDVPDVVFFGIPLVSQVAMYYVFMPIMVLILLASRMLLKSRIGRAVCAVRDNELAAATLGVQTSSFFILAFAWSGFVVGIAGSMFAILVGRVVPESFNMLQLIMHFAIVMIGGLGTLLGPVLGAIILTSVPELFRAFPGGDEIVFGSLLILVLVFFPQGLVGLAEKVVPRLKQRLYRE